MAYGDGGDDLDVRQRQAGGGAELEHPQVKHDERPDDLLDGTDAPR